MRLARFTLVFAVGIHFTWAQTSEDRQQYKEHSQGIYNSDPARRPDFIPPAPDRDGPAVGRLREIVMRTISGAASAPDATAESVRQAIVALQGEDSLANAYPETKIPYVHIADLNGGRVLVVAFGVMSGGIGIPGIHTYMQFYTGGSGTWKLQSEVGSDFEGRAFSAATINSPNPGEVWCLVWGKQIGDTGARLRVHLYAFDGQSVRKIWERDALRGGLARVNDRQVILEYDDLSTKGVGLPPLRKVEVLQPTPNGLEP